jgi:drug/metabolite transporter (DMT)-like permease
MHVGMVFGILAAVSWGLGDFLITRLTRRVGTYPALLAIQALSLLGWLIVLAARPGHAPMDAALWGLVLGTALCHVLGLVFTYRAFEIGTLSLVSPISSGFAVVTALLALASGEHPPVLTLLGALALVIGVVLATGSAHQGPVKLAGVPEAIASALAFGTMFWLFYFFVQPRLGYAWPLVLLKVLATGASWIQLRSRREETVSAGPWRTPTTWWIALGAAGADTVAWLAYIMGTATAYATVVTALASLFSVVTVILAWRFLRERLARHQWAGVAIILVGILLVSW